MRNKIMAALACAGAIIAVPAHAEEREAPLNVKAEQKLAERLEGRVAGEPVRCIRSLPGARTTIYDDTAIVWKVGGTLYVNRPDAGARSLDRHDIMVLRKSVPQLCSIDTIEMVDQNGFMSGIIFLGDFVPWRRVES